MNAAIEFKKSLGERIEPLLPSGYKFYRSKQEWKKKTSTGYDVIQICGKNKFSPYIDVLLSFGKRFNEVSKIERLMNCDLFDTHISQGSDFILNYMELPYVGSTKWNIDIENPFDGLEREVVNAIYGLAIPFLECFSTIEDARYELEKREGCRCYSFHWMQLFHFNAALSSVSRFKEWSAILEPEQKQMADDYVSRYEDLLLEINDKREGV